MQAKINLSGAIGDCREAGYDGLILDQVRADGLGSDLVLESEMNDAKEVQVLNLLRWLYSQFIGFAAIRKLLEVF